MKTMHRGKLEHKTLTDLFLDVFELFGIVCLYGAVLYVLV